MQTLMQILSWLKVNWQLVAAAAYAVLNLVQAITPHYSGLGGAQKWLLWLVERLAMLTSSDAATSAPFTRIKLPLQNVPPNSEKKTRPPITMVLLMLLLGGCATTGIGRELQDQADRIRMAAQIASAAIDPMMHRQCMLIADDCGAKQDKECLALKECQDNRQAIDELVKQALVAADLLCAKK